MNTTDINKEFYNKLYRNKSPFLSLIHSWISFDQQSKSELNFSILRNYLKDDFRKKLVILDYGFGHGSLLLKFRKNHELYGSDISDEAVFNFPKVAKLVGKKVTTVPENKIRDELGNVKFDIITLSHVIEHVEDDADLVKRLSERLSHQGLILINVPVNEVWDDPKHVRKYDLNYLNRLMEECGLDVLSTFETDKLTSFFLTEEKVKKAGLLKKIFLRTLKVIFAILPLRMTRLFEKIFLKNHKNQQLVILGSKK